MILLGSVYSFGQLTCSFDGFNCSNYVSHVFLQYLCIYRFYVKEVTRWLPSGSELYSFCTWKVILLMGSMQPYLWITMCAYTFLHGRVYMHDPDPSLIILWGKGMNPLQFMTWTAMRRILLFLSVRFNISDLVKK